MEETPAKGKKISILVVAAALLAFVLLTSVYFVREGEYAIIKQFGKVTTISDTPGIGFKMPFINSKESLTKRIEFYDVQPSDVITRDKKSMIVDTYAVWRITEPLKFLQTAGSIGELERRIEATVYGSLKTTIGSLNQADIIESRQNNSINVTILKNSSGSLEKYGVELIDVQIKRFDLLPSNKEAVFTRMISERNNIRASLVAEGEEEANKIKNTADSQEKVIISQAEAQAEETIAEGEREYMKVLSAAYATPERAEFYKFIRELDALKVTMKGDKTIILDKDSPLVRILNGQ